MKIYSPTEAMVLAIAEAKKGEGFVSPNPLVGCVILSANGNLLAKGYHRKCGQAHAEVEALSVIGNTGLLEGAVVYVTLEPCAHQGRTPSCAKTLARLPISSVVYGLKDPNPLVSGKGIEILKAAGKDVSQFIELKDELEELAEVFLFNQREQSTFIALKIASSLDGVVALNSGESQWITNSDSRNHGHSLRLKYDAILIGVGTLLADNPSLNVRRNDIEAKENKVIILDPKLRSLKTLKDSNVYKTHSPKNIIIVCENSPVGNLFGGVCFLEMDRDDRDFFSPKKLSKLLYQFEGICSVYVEGGPNTYGQFLEARCFQRFYQFIAPNIIGLGGGRGWSQSMSVEAMADRINLKKIKYKELGNNIMITGTL